MKFSLFSTRAVFASCCVALCLLVTTPLTAQPGPMLSYHLTHDMLRTDDHFSVVMYEDGTALVHYPVHMEMAGDYTVQLSPSEVQAIRLLLEHPLVQDFDPGQVGAQKRHIDEQSEELFAISDDSYSNFDIGIPGAEKSVRWANLEVDAGRYPEIGVFAKLADIEAELLQLAEHPSSEAVAK
jgi:hypothetical protein